MLHARSLNLKPLVLVASGRGKHRPASCKDRSPANLGLRALFTMWIWQNSPILCSGRRHLLLDHPVCRLGQNCGAGRCCCAAQRCPCPLQPGAEHRRNLSLATQTRDFTGRALLRNVLCCWPGLHHQPWHAHEIVFNFQPDLHSLLHEWSKRCFLSAVRRCLAGVAIAFLSYRVGAGRALGLAVVMAPWCFSRAIWLSGLGLLRSDCQDRLRKIWFECCICLDVVEILDFLLQPRIRAGLPLRLDPQCRHHLLRFDECF